MRASIRARANGCPTCSSSMRRINARSLSPTARGTKYTLERLIPTWLARCVTGSG
jgi:hypothetical protein